MSELVNKVAEILNAPVDLVQRSAEARAEASGVSVDDVLIKADTSKILLTFLSLIETIKSPLLIPAD